MRILALACLTTTLMLASCDSSSNSSTAPQSSQPGVVGTWKADSTLVVEGGTARLVWVRTFSSSGIGTDSLTGTSTSGATSQTFKVAQTFTWTTSGRDILIQYASCKESADLRTWTEMTCPGSESIPNGALSALGAINVILDGDVFTLRKQ